MIFKVVFPIWGTEFGLDRVYDIIALNEWAWQREHLGESLPKKAVSLDK